MQTDEFEEQSQQYHIVEMMTPTQPIKLIKEKKISDLAQPQLKFKLVEKEEVRNKSRLIQKKQQLVGTESIFNKNFESGNLQSVHRLDFQTYLITLSNDTNTNRYSQWFYFSCKDISFANFIIRGFKKSESLYNKGMKICIKQGNNKWKKDGINIKYVEGDSSYQLKFSYKFTNPKLKTLFAYSFPYSYSQLIDFIAQKQNKYSPYFSKQIICKTYQGRNVYCLSIGNQQAKDVIIITARVHPGQTVSSYVIQGFIQKLLSDTKQMQLIRKNFLFKIIPMLNPDGVFLGNYRTSFTGCDLNRKWQLPSYKLHSQIYYTKAFIQNLKLDKNIIMYLDLHGHSRKKNAFFYGCQDDISNPTCREFPYLMSKISPYFNYQKCSFDIQKQKTGTARICLWKQLRISHVYTLEVSFSGSELGEDYQIEDYQKIGQKLLSGIIINFSELQSKKIPLINHNNAQYPNIQYFQKITEIRRKFLSELYANKQLLTTGFLVKDNGSESDPSEGLIEQQKIEIILQKATQINRHHKALNLLNNQIKDPKKRRRISSEEASIEMNTIKRFSNSTKLSQLRFLNQSKNKQQTRIMKKQKRLMSIKLNQTKKIYQQYLPSQVQHLQSQKQQKESYTEQLKKLNELVVKTNFDFLKQPIKKPKKVILIERNPRFNTEKRISTYLNTSQAWKFRQNKTDIQNKQLNKMIVVHPLTSVKSSIFKMPTSKMKKQKQQSRESNQLFKIQYEKRNRKKLSLGISPGNNCYGLSEKQSV